MNMIEALGLAYENKLTYVRPERWLGTGKALYYPQGSKCPRVKMRAKFACAPYAHLPEIGDVLDDWQEVTAEELGKEAEGNERARAEAYKVRRRVFERAR